MLDTLKKHRELLAWIAAAVVGLTQLQALVTILWGLVDGMSFSTVIKSVGYGLDQFAYVILLLLVLACVAVPPPTKQVKLLATITLALGAVGFVGDLISGVIYRYDYDGLRPFTTTLNTTIAFLLATVFRGLLVAIAYVLWQAAQRTAPAQAGVAPGTQVAPAGTPALTRPTWQASEASGGAWTRAGDAATGAGASAWGTPGQSSQGWQVPSQQAAQQQPGQQQPGQSYAPQGQPPAPQYSAPEYPAQQSSATPPPANQPWLSAGQAAQGMTQPGQPQSQSSAPTDAEDGTILRPQPQWRPVDRDGQ
ncbi:hypothetical protein [Aestuariimicrobium ganziense]|uniref:hypothetical protein n=1 Tax=Aestuariimicrobium ganziense TaxID=2773677 RepID=UPI001944C12F|nr:hypothetical protein [Aestuariimicrobium ganziense]